VQKISGHAAAKQSYIFCGSTKDKFHIGMSSPPARITVQTCMYSSTISDFPLWPLIT